MALSLQKTEHKPPRILIYGPQGLGKSTFGSQADTPVFIQTEDGLDALSVPAYPLAKSFGDIMVALDELAEQDHDFKTVVIDSIDWLEPLVWAQLIAENPRASNGKTIAAIEDFGYGKGYAMAVDLWREYLQKLNTLRDERGMTVIQIAHAEIKRFENPTTDPYDRYQIKLHRAAASLMMEHSDIVLFANYSVGTKTKKEGMGERTRAIGSGERLLFTEERPAYLAKNRYSLPSEIPFTKDGSHWNVIANHIPFYS